jgi:hypothetical protein
MPVSLYGVIMKMTPQKAIDSILKQAPQMLKEDKHHAPILFIFGEHENAIVLIEFKDTESKYSAMLTTGRKLAFLKPHCIAFVSEAWISKTFPPEGKNVSDMSDKQEALQAIAQNLEGEIKAAAIPFSRVGKDILFGEPIESSEAESYLLELFWRGVRESSH